MSHWTNWQMSNNLLRVPPFHDLFRELATAAFTKDGALCVELHHALKVVLRRAVLANADVVGGHSLHTSVLVKQDFRGTEA